MFWVNKLYHYRVYGCLMASDWEQDAPWRKKKLAKQAAKLAAEDSQADTSALAGEG